MKTKTIKIFAIFLMAVAFVNVTSAQLAANKSETKGTKKPAKIAKAKVPAVVTETYYKEYPLAATTYENWYGYPSYDFGNDWYGYDPFLFEYEYPEYYIVEFTKNKVPHTVVYSKAGKKIATHKKITSDLPAAINAAIAKSEYSTWKVEKEKEEIFRDTEMDKMKVYKVEVEKGKATHELFYSSEGALLKDRTIKS